MVPFVIRIHRLTRLSAGFESVISWLEEAGLSLTHPTPGVPTSHALGGQLKTTPETVRNQLLEKRRGNVQLWFEPGKDVFVEWTTDDCYVSLHRKPSPEQIAVMQFFLAKFATLYQELDWIITIGHEGAVVEGIEAEEPLEYETTPFWP